MAERPGGPVIAALAIQLDFLWPEPVQLRPEMVERLRLDLESRAENFLVIEGCGDQSGLDDVAVSSEAKYP